MFFPSTGDPVSVVGQLSAAEGCASISDNNGQLLFYTNGKDVYDGNHNLICNDLRGEGSSTQAALIVPKPLSLNKYYIITTPEWGGYNWQGPEFAYLYYSEVTVGIGNSIDVNPKNIQLYNQSLISEKLTATCSGNGSEIWVIAHESPGPKTDPSVNPPPTNKFLFYLVSASGITLHHTQNIGLSYKFGTPSYYVPGQMKVSPDGTKLAVATYAGGRRVEVYDFNNSTGYLSNYRYIETGTKAAYGVEFSHDSKLIYVGYDAQGSPKGLHQLKIEATSLIEKYFSNTGDIGLWSLQMGPDGRLYIAERWRNYLGIINNPDIEGSGCNFVIDGINLRSGICNNGLPNNFYQCGSFCTALNVSISSDTTIYYGYGPGTATLTVNVIGGTPPYTYLWSNNSTTQTINVNPTTNTSYTVSVTDKNNCKGNNTVTVSVVDVRCGNKMDKVLVCQNDNNYHTICISPNAVPAHLAHGDYLGNCNDNPNLINGNQTTEFKLHSNYPNPFNPVTRISFDIPKQAFVSLKIYDMLGREVKTLVNEVKIPGNYVVDFNGSELSSGVYFYRLQSAEFIAIKKMTLIK
mgnify:CR=1 FL=1